MELMPGVLPPGWKNFAVKVPRILEVTESRGPPKIPKTRKHHADEDIPKEDGAEQTRKDMAITGAEQSTKEDMAITGAAPDGDIIEGVRPRPRRRQKPRPKPGPRRRHKPRQRPRRRHKLRPRKPRPRRRRRTWLGKPRPRRRGKPR